MNRLIEVFVLALCSPWTSVATTVLWSVLLALTLMLRHGGE